MVKVAIIIMSYTTITKKIISVWTGGEIFPGKSFWLYAVHYIILYYYGWVIMMQ